MQVFLWRTALGILRLFRRHLVTLDLGNLVRFLGHLSDAFVQARIPGYNNVDVFFLMSHYVCIFVYSAFFGV